MACLYILYSKKLERYYTGSCNEFDKRLLQHVSGDDNSSFTAKADDWEVFLMLDGLSYRQSRDIEAHVKKMKSSKYIRNLAKYPELLKKLVERYK